MTQVETLQQLLSRQACRMIVGGFRPPSDPFTSWFGKVSVALAEESWPVFEGKPMMGLCQINCNELPMRPQTLADVTFITLFIAADWLHSIETANGAGWLLRAYGTEQPLTPLQPPPSTESSVKAFPIRWELIEHDYPCWEDAETMLEENGVLAGKDMDEINEISDWYGEQRDLFPTHYCSKIGGWPSLIQGEVFKRWGDETTYVFQIDSETKAHWGWGDNGIGYFGYLRGQNHGQWFMEWQSL